MVFLRRRDNPPKCGAGTQVIPILKETCQLAFTSLMIGLLILFIGGLLATLLGVSITAVGLVADGIASLVMEVTQ